MKVDIDQFRAFYSEFIANIKLQGSLTYSVYNLPQIKIGNIGIRIRQYIKANWGSPFIVGFMILLTGAAVFLSIGLQSLADTIIVTGFYLLIIGVFLQLICFFKYPHKGKGETN